MVLLLILLSIALVAIAGTVIVAVRDGYRRVPSRGARTLEA
jgi:hypothetical protein